MNVKKCSTDKHAPYFLVTKNVSAIAPAADTPSTNTFCWPPKKIIFQPTDDKKHNVPGGIFDE
jgi:hypothetical protein